MMDSLPGIPDVTEILKGILVFLRIGGVMFTLPLIGDSPTPVRARSFLALALTFMFFPVVGPNWAPSFNVDLFQLIGYALAELLIGVTMGFLVRTIFDAIIMAASVVAFQMGFGTASMFLPDAGASYDSFTAFHRILVLLIFLSLNLHYMFFDGLAKTFALIPGGAAGVSGYTAEIFFAVSAQIFSIALQLAAPILVTMLFTTAALGLIARTVPQMNVFIISFPVSFFLGLVVYIASLPFYPEWMLRYFSDQNEYVMAAVRSLSTSM